MTTPRFQRMLVPLDGSPLAEQAIPMAGALARRAGAAVHLVSVQPGLPRYPYVPSEISQEVEREVRQRKEAYLKAQAEAIETCYGREAVWAVRDGDPAGTLASYGRNNEIDLIIMTTHGRGGLSRFWLGSVADRLVRCTTTPVLLLRSEKQPQTTDLRHVLVALDGSEAGAAVLEPALALASLFHERCCTLVQVIEPPATIPWDLATSELDSKAVEEQQTLATRGLERHAAKAAAAGVASTATVQVAATAGAQILALAEKIDSDVIAIGTHGVHGLERLLLGSVADKVVRGAERPVLVVPIGRRPG
jgi:nucleotide-binding universal stress UspA family protein